MCPLSVSTSRSTHALETGEAKLWSLLVGVNQYQDARLPSLSYSASDCQGLTEALAEATQGFPRKEPIAHHDFATHPPTLEAVRQSLEQIVAAAQPQDTILLYFSGHGVLDRETGQVVLCLADTSKDNLLQTGLKLPDVLELLQKSQVHRQMLWLDACHSGDLTLRGAKGEVTIEQPELNPAQQLMEVLRQRATQSRGFYALLSCDRKQRSWEFPELKHGLFTYYLMQGLRGEAADTQGVIDADGLYKYVYHQTIQYIDRLNHQLRLMNQQKRSRGELDLHPEYPLQTPKRIVEGVGELVLGLKVDERIPQPVKHSRRALVCDGFADSNAVYAFSRALQTAGNFALEYFPQSGKAWTDARYAIQSCLRSPVSSQEPETVLLYLRGRMEAIADGEAWLVMGDSLRLSRSWLQQELRRSATARQIILLDFLGTERSSATLQEWIEELQLSGGKQCIIAAAPSDRAPEQFTHALLETLAAKEPSSPLSVTAWMDELQQKLERMGMPLHLWLSETAGDIEIFPPTTLTATKFVPSPPKPPRIEKPAVSHSTPKVQPPTAAASPPPAPAPAIPLPAKEYFSQQYAQLEKILRELVGPIAPTLLSQVATPNSQPHHWVENLLPILSPQQQNQLRQQSISLLQQIPGSQPQTRSSSCATSWQHETLSENFIHQCEQALSAAIGPIATFLIQNTIKSQPQISRSELIEILATAIHDPLQAAAFRRRLL